MTVKTSKMMGMGEDKNVISDEATVSKMRALIRVIDGLPPLPELQPSKQLIHNGRKPR